MEEKEKLRRYVQGLIEKEVRKCVKQHRQKIQENYESLEDIELEYDDNMELNLDDLMMKGGDDEN